jgi:hypothetical protein
VHLVAVHRTHSGREVLAAVTPPDMELQNVSVEFESMSVALDRPPGGARWRFRFYDTEDIIARVWVSADGTRVIGP